MTIALLAAIESLLCAVVADGMVDDRHDSNQELMAQGLANIVSPLFGGIAATGAIARTATNVKSGARTPVAGIVHAVTLLVIILVAAPLAKFIPLATLSAVLVNVALHMGEWHNFARLRKWPICDSAVFLSAFGLTVVVDLTVAVEIGMVLAAILFIKRSSETTQIMAVDESTETEGSQHSLVGKEVPKGVMIYRIFGAFFFGAADKLESVLKREKQEPEVLILRMRKVVAMDATGPERARGPLRTAASQRQTPGPERPAHQAADGDGEGRLSSTASAAKTSARTLTPPWPAPAKSSACPPPAPTDPNHRGEAEARSRPPGADQRAGPRQQRPQLRRPRPRSRPRCRRAQGRITSPSKWNRLMSALRG